MFMIKPRALYPGGRIAVVAISSPGEPARYDAGIDHLRALGYRAEAAPNLTTRSRSYLAGPDQLRLELINSVLHDSTWDAIVFARGGYGATRILDQIDWAAAAANPRPTIGYSDITAYMHAAWATHRFSTFHGPMVHLDFAAGLEPERQQWFTDALAGAAGLSWRVNGGVITEGRAEGPLFGGCLSLVVAMMGTPLDGWIDDGIFFWEDVDEPTYRIDRMLTQLKLAGRLRRIRGVIIGGLKGCGGPGEGELDEVLNEFFRGRGVPVIREAPFGHHGNNLLLPYGQRVVVDTSSGTITFPEPMVER